MIDELRILRIWEKEFIPGAIGNPNLNYKLVSKDRLQCRLDGSWIWYDIPVIEETNA